MVFFLNHGISETGYLFPCSRTMAWRYLTQLGPTEEANQATDKASTPFQLKMETRSNFRSGDFCMETSLRTGTI